MSNIKKYFTVLDNNYHLFQKNDCNPDQYGRYCEGYNEVDHYV